MHNERGAAARQGGEVSTRAPADVAVEIRCLDEVDDLLGAMSVFREIWAFPDGEAPISAELLRALAFAGGYVAGAFADGAMVGASAGFLAQRDGALHLHSHISGVTPPYQGKHVGLALKQHQRQWALDRGVDAVEWTFDPLVRRNAFFNLEKLGAVVVDFKADFYGEMHDAINAGDPTDRAVVQWDLKRERASTARDDGAVILHAGDDGQPIVDKAGGDVFRAWVPDDIVALRHADPERARAWRLALRDSFGAAINDGYHATAMSRDGWYRLERETA
jgi:predicted GNAT superfamily acetyltransferase